MSPNAEENAVATLSVLKFNDPDGADRVLIALQDAAVISRPQGDKRPQTRQLHSTAGAGALTSDATAPDKIIDELKQYDVEIISTNLPEEQERRLREAFAQES